jgi:tRNA dimethylallyltransferase
MRENTTLIAGPTASGKSAYAVQIAKERDGVVVNADSMQVYDVLRVLTARPSDDDMAGVEHRLYGHVHPSQLYSTGRWLSDVEALLADPSLEGRHLVFVGGTGLYFKALLGGLSQMPEIPDEVRNYWRQRLMDDGSVQLHDELAARDAETAAWLKPQDGQRIVRAIEVFETSGKPISHWQKQSGKALICEAESTKICLAPDREILRAKINRRFALMLKTGALEEVRALNLLDLDPALPAMKAIGVREITAFFADNMTFDDVITLCSAATRQYAKRQMTWMRNQFDESWQRIITP